MIKVENRKTNGKGSLKKHKNKPHTFNLAGELYPFLMNRNR